MKRLAALILLSLLLGVGGLLLAAGGDLFDRSLWVPATARPAWWFAAALLTLSAWLLPAWKIRVLASRQGVTLPWYRAWFAHVSGVFGTAMTPSSSGGGPAIVLTLHRYGLSYGRGSGVAVQFFVLDMAAFAAIIPLGMAYLVTGADLHLPRALDVLAVVTAVVALGVATFLGRFPRPVVRLALWLSHRRWLARVRTSLSRAAWDYYRAARGFTRMPAGTFLGLLLLSAVVWLANFLLLWVLLRAFGIPVPALEAVALLSVLTLGSFAVPTPGASGFMEFVMALLLADRASGTAPPAGPILYWRLLTFYAAYLVGPVVGWAILLERPPRWLRAMLRRPRAKR